MLVIPARDRRIEALPIARVLPAPVRRLVGPFIFFDHMGPAELPASASADIRPHPHIHLATVTYLFSGELLHRDSLGSEQLIRPGEVNWMTAGRGIVHSERTPPTLRNQPKSMHGIQLWVALPTAHEDAPPEFQHHDASALPERDVDGVHVKLLAGSALGLRAPVRTSSPLFYAEAHLAPGTRLELSAEHAERAVYVVHGRVRSGHTWVERQSLGVFPPESPAVLEAEERAHVMLLGGAPLEGRRYIWWNFVSSSKAAIEAAAARWREGGFPVVPSDEHERIPAPAGPILLG